MTEGRGSVGDSERRDQCRQGPWNWNGSCGRQVLRDYFIGTGAIIWSPQWPWSNPGRYTVYPKKYAHGFVVLCFVVVMQSFIMNSHEVFIHILQGCFAGTGAIARLPQCQWRKPDGYGKIGQCITTTKHSKAKNVCIFLGIYCIWTNHLKRVGTLTQTKHSSAKLCAYFMVYTVLVVP